MVGSIIELISNSLIIKRLVLNGIEANKNDYGVFNHQLAGGGGRIDNLIY